MQPSLLYSRSGIFLLHDSLSCGWSAVARIGTELPGGNYCSGKCSRPSRNNAEVPDGVNYGDVRDFQNTRRLKHNRVLLISTDPAHSLGDAFQTKFTPGTPVKIVGQENLEVLEVDPGTALEEEVIPV